LCYIAFSLGIDNRYRQFPPQREGMAFWRFVSN
jgi:hypothetical protein